MRSPVLLDLFCGAGGATKGYQRAGFYVIGVDSKDQPHYCGDEFVKSDAIEAMTGLGMLPKLTAIHASPPCHDHTAVVARNRKAPRLDGSGWMLEKTIEMLQSTGLPWVVENVGNAEFPCDTVQLCGSSFGLDVRRHRKFASNVPLAVPPCNHSWQTPRFRSLDSRTSGLSSVVPVYGHLNYPGEFDLRCKAMGVDWMTNAELTQAIPPAYTEHIGRQLMASLLGGAA